MVRVLEELDPEIEEQSISVVRDHENPGINSQIDTLQSIINFDGSKRA